MKVLTLKVLNQDSAPATYYLPLLTDRESLPLVLGTGRNAVVLLAWTQKDRAQSRYLALKFLKDDANREYAQMCLKRFKEELTQTRRFADNMDFFVKYEGAGFLGNSEAGQEFWKDFSEQTSSKLINDEAEFSRIKNHFGIQGPFYILDLCQGTLHDLLEKDDPWLEATKIYQSIEKYKDAFERQSEEIKHDIMNFKEIFITREAWNKNISGFEILNAFKNEDIANRVRSYSVLKLFLEIARTVDNLHSMDLTHRDLKLGNIFLRHAANPNGFDKINFKLADLGYVAEVIKLSKNNESLQIDNWRTPGALVPGSQFYRAPEQSRLPIEVRVNIDKTDKCKAIIKGSKLGDIEKGDTVVIGDYFGGEAAKDGVKRINNVIKTGSTFEVELDSEVDLSLEEDLQAHIIKSTGFHTDGFSLGAILYDLISGGKNPEDFYTYCLARFQKAFKEEKYSVNDIVSSLFPERQLKNVLARSVPLTSVGNPLVDAIKFAFRDQSQKNQIEISLESELVKDNRDVPIPDEILGIIVKCMVRDVDKAYYSSTPTQGYHTQENRKASSRLVTDVQRILNDFENLPISESLKDNPLIKLRMFWHSNSFEEKTPSSVIYTEQYETDQNSESSITSSHFEENDQKD